MPSLVGSEMCIRDRWCTAYGLISPTLPLKQKEKYCIMEVTQKLEVQITKEYKDRLFRLVFGEKEDLLALYNAVNESAYSNPEPVSYTHLTLPTI